MLGARGLYWQSEQIAPYEHRDAFNTGAVIRANLPQDCLVFSDGPSLFCGTWEGGSFNVTKLGPHGVDDGFPADSAGNITALLHVREGGNAGWLLAPSEAAIRLPLDLRVRRRGNRWGSASTRATTLGRIIRSMGNTRTSAGVSILVINEDNGTAGDTTPYRFENFVENPLLVDDYKYAPEGKLVSMQLEAATPNLDKGFFTIFAQGERITDDSKLEIKAATVFDGGDLSNAPSLTPLRSLSLAKG